MFRSALCALLLLLPTAAATAQDAPPGRSLAAVVEGLAWDRLVDVLTELAGNPVYTVDGRRIGVLSEILADGDGEPATALIYGDSFFDLDGGRMDLPFAALRLVDGRLVAPVTWEAAVAAMGKDGPFD